MTQADNRREHARHDVAVSAEVLLGEDRIPGLTRNLSMGGVGLELARALPEHAQLVVNLFLVEDGIEDAMSPSMNIKATVIWTAESAPGRWEAGLRFVQLQSEQAKLIHGFLKRLPPQ